MKTTSQNQSSAPGLQSRTEHHSGAKGVIGTEGKPGLPTISFERRRENMRLATGQILNLLRLEAPDLLGRVEIIEHRIAITFDQKQPSTITARLAELGFSWNRRRQNWQHPCGRIVTGNRSPA